jgi:hypothetical protein
MYDLYYWQVFASADHASWSGTASTATTVTLPYIETKHGNFKHTTIFCDFLTSRWWHWSDRGIRVWQILLYHLQHILIDILGNMLNATVNISGNSRSVCTWIHDDTRSMRSIFLSRRRLAKADGRTPSACSLFCFSQHLLDTIKRILALRYVRYRNNQRRRISKPGS